MKNKIEYIVNVIIKSYGDEVYYEQPSYEKVFTNLKEAIDYAKSLYFLFTTMKENIPSNYCAVVIEYQKDNGSFDYMVRYPVKDLN